jgi:hypothetical protein
MAAVINSSLINYRVDLWFTDLNEVEFGLFRRARYRAKSRQFTADMDVFGAISQNGERTGLLSYRESLWKTDNPASRRLVIKLFTPAMAWRGSLDFLVARSLQLSVGAGGFPVTAYAVNLHEHEQMIQLERSARKFPLSPETFSFFLLEGREPRFYRLRRDRFSLTRDYSLFDQRGDQIGHLNGHFWDLGGRWDIEIAGKHDTPALNSTLQLFCGMLRYNKMVRRHVRELAGGVRDGALKVAVDTQEGNLYANPRGHK